MGAGDWKWTCWPFVIALILALVDWVAVARRAVRLRYVSKPATLLAVFVGAWLLTRGPHDPWQARFFLPGLAFSLVGDVCLLLPGKRWFVAGLVAFFLAQLCYIAGLTPTLPRDLPPYCVLGFLIVVALVGVVLVRSIAAGLRRKNRRMALLIPLAIYGPTLSLTLFSGWATLFRPEWTPLRRVLVILGVSLFFTSDLLIVWDRFVRRSHRLKFLDIITYHLAQVALALSIALW
jgi:uncharacterized membrane protein YhhN